MVYLISPTASVYPKAARSSSVLVHTKGLQPGSPLRLSFWKELDFLDVILLGRFALVSGRLQFPPVGSRGDFAILLIEMARHTEAFGHFSQRNDGLHADRELDS